MKIITFLAGLLWATLSYAQTPTITFPGSRLYGNQLIDNLYDQSAAPPNLSAWTQVNIGATVSLTQSPAGTISLVDAGSTGTVLHGIMIPVPTVTPYRVRLLFQSTYHVTGNFMVAEVGWSDGTKFETITTYYGGIVYQTWNTYNSRAGYSIPLPGVLWGNGVYYFGLLNDGTNLKFQFSADGENWDTVYSELITASFLGVGQQNYIFVGLHNETGLFMAHALRAYDVNSYGKTFP